MKNLLFLLLPAFIIACGGGVEQYRASVETLVTQWDSTTASVTELSSNISNDLSEISKSASELTISEEAMAKMKPEQVTEWQTAQQNFTQSLQGYAPLRTEIGEFTKAWGEEATKVQSLKEGLESGQLPADVATQVDSLNTLITQAKENVATWQAKYAEVKAAAMGGLETLKSTHATLVAETPAK